MAFLDLFKSTAKPHNLNSLGDTSKIWIYQANRFFTDEEVESITALGNAFTTNWKSHQHPVKGAFEVFYNLFVVIAADEDASAGVSGCSIDSSVKIIKEIEATTGVNLFDRMLLSYRDAATGQIELLKMPEFSNRLKSGDITPETMVFNNLVTTLGDFKNGWEVPLKHSWHKQLL